MAAANTNNEGAANRTRYASVVSHIREKFDMMRMHRNSANGWGARLLQAQRTFNGEYSAHKLAEISKFGGSQVYARVTAVKCRGATALLRDIYLSGPRPWGIDPTPEPTLPDDIMADIHGLVASEAMSLQQSGVQVTLEMVRDRMTQLTEAAAMANQKKARQQAIVSERRVDDILVEGGFYDALAEVLTDITIFPFVCLKGPVVRMVQKVKWVNGTAVKRKEPQLIWVRVSPFDIYFTPGVSSFADAEVIERVRYTRSDLIAVKGVPGYDDAAIDAALADYANSGSNIWTDGVDSQRAAGESREDPNMNRSRVIDGVEYHGSLSGLTLLSMGVSPDEIPDPMDEYAVQVWVVGNHVIKLQLTPSPRKRHPYFATSFEKVPGTVVGNALPDILDDIQDVCNATLRALVNNLSIASGPQVVVDMDQVAAGENPEDLYPWKRWKVQRDPMVGNNGAGTKPVDFFSPQSHAAELLGVYEKFTQIADELSAIPRYVTGSERLGGAGRTASGLAMLMGNASKVLQNVAANIDRELIAPALHGLYDLLMLTDTTGVLRGDESIRVQGVAVAIQKETNRQRQIEFLSVTNNPVDLGIIGMKGRASVLRAVSNEIGLQGESVVPPESEVEAAEKAQQEQAKAQAAQQMLGGVAPAGPGDEPPQQQNHRQPANLDLGVPEAKAMRGMA